MPEFASPSSSPCTKLRKGAVLGGSARHGPDGSAIHVPQNKNPAEAGFCWAKRTIDGYCRRVPITSISTRRFLARPSPGLLSATRRLPPLPPLVTRVGPDPVGAGVALCDFGQGARSSW